jgi:hypothetical protein
MGKKRRIKQSLIYDFSVYLVLILSETNLKIRQGLQQTVDILTPEAVSQLTGKPLSLK